jgi:hypothetical protein
VKELKWLTRSGSRLMLTVEVIRDFIDRRICSQIPIANTWDHGFDFDLDISIEIERVISYNKTASALWRWFDSLFDSQSHGFGLEEFSMQEAWKRARELEEFLVSVYGLD